ncbi:MAG: DUF4399 domain-containing protein [Pseudomonadales bacterium]|jgi:hypothetical protein|nr:DUF4399 domain-containing protein [Pseudomonadales bacterium]
MIRKLSLLTFSSLLFAGFALAQAAEPAALPRSVAPADAKVYILSPANGATVESPFTVVFGLSGMGVAPAGIEFENAGHHHLLIDTDLPANLSLPLPADEQHVHFGKGQTEASITLPPGQHTLQLVLGDHLHIPFDPPVVSEKITVTVAP